MHGRLRASQVSVNNKMGFRCCMAFVGRSALAGAIKASQAHLPPMAAHNLHLLSANVACHLHDGLCVLSNRSLGPERPVHVR